MAGNNDPSPPRLRVNPVIYKSSALAATAPNLANKTYDSACIAAAAATAEEVRKRFKEGQVDAQGNAIPVVSGDGEAADAQRHKRRVALNRNSAASSRVRKEAYVSALEAQLANLERHYNTLFQSLEPANPSAQFTRSDHDTSAAEAVALTPAAPASPSAGATAVAALAAEAISSDEAPKSTPVPPPPPAPRQSHPEGHAQALAPPVMAQEPHSVPAGAVQMPKVEEAVEAVDGGEAVEAMDAGPADAQTAAPAMPDQVEPPAQVAVEAQFAALGVVTAVPLAEDSIGILPQLAEMDPGLAEEMARITGTTDSVLINEPETEPLADLLQAYNALDGFADQFDG